MLSSELEEYRFWGAELKLVGELKDPESLLTATEARGRRQTDGAAGGGGGRCGVRRGTGILEGQMAARRTRVVGT